FEVFRAHSDAAMIVHNLEAPAVASRGVLDAQSLDNQHDAIDQINANLRGIAGRHKGIYVLDYDALIARHGRLSWGDDARHVSLGLPVSSRHFLDLCDEWMRFLQPLTGKIAKAVVVDLDNTLWGGVLGEDGIAGIQ